MRSKSFLVRAIPLSDVITPFNLHAIYFSLFPVHSIIWNVLTKIGGGLSLS